MKIIGIICEYNPLHRGHEKQIHYIKESYPGCAVVCLMSGNFVQRGMPAIVDKSLRAKAALLSGADLVLELPVTYALSSAEGFAAGGVKILGSFCDGLCFGSETGDKDALVATAQALLSVDFPEKLRSELDKGLSFPAARQAALGEMGTLLEKPNDILAVEYCKAILSQDSKMEILPIRREGSYHDEFPDAENPSATAVRNWMEQSLDWSTFVPNADIYKEANLHFLRDGEKAILYRLRTMTDVEFEALPYGSEGLWRKFMHACRKESSLEAIIAATKSKRYTRTRIDRMIMCAFLGITKEMLESPAPWSRVLGLNDTGRLVLKKAREVGHFPNAGEKLDHPYGLLEHRADSLYGLFAATPESPDAADIRRVVYLR